MDDNVCPHCGNRHLARYGGDCWGSVQTHCARCGAHGPVAKTTADADSLFSQPKHLMIGNTLVPSGFLVQLRDKLHEVDAQEREDENEWTDTCTLIAELNHLIAVATGQMDLTDETQE